MSTLNSINNQSHHARFAFIEILSSEFFSKTGLGIYACYSPADVDQLYQEYCDIGMPMLAFAKQCIKKRFA